MSDIGHNSAAYGEQIFTESFVLGDDHKKLFHYVQWQLSDYITGTQGMTVDQEGVYMRFLVRLYDRGRAFPNDDRLMARVMGMDLRPWKRIKSQLIEMGKILMKSDCLTNARFEKERQKRAAELRKQAEKTREYWEKKRAEKDTSDELPRNFRETSGELPRKVQPKVSKKSNEINENGQHPNRHTRESRVQSLEERKKESPPASAGPPPQGHGRKKSAPKFRLAEDWCLDFEWRSRTKQKFGITDVQIDKEAERFKRYWTSPDAKNPRKADWWRTWENWIDRAMERGIRVPGGQTHWRDEEADRRKQLRDALEKVKAEYNG